MSLTLPDPWTSEDDPMDVYLLKCEKAVRDATEAHRTLSTPETRQELHAAVQGLRQAELNVRGVECPRCGGCGADPRPFGGVHFDCRLCQAEGAVMKPIADKYLAGGFSYGP